MGVRVPPISWGRDTERPPPVPKLVPGASSARGLGTRSGSANTLRSARAYLEEIRSTAQELSQIWSNAPEGAETEEQRRLLQQLELKVTAAERALKPGNAKPIWRSSAGKGSSFSSPGAFFQGGSAPVLSPRRRPRGPPPERWAACSLRSERDRHVAPVAERWP